MPCRFTFQALTSNYFNPQWLPPPAWRILHCAQGGHEVRANNYFQIPVYPHLLPPGSLPPSLPLLPSSLVPQLPICLPRMSFMRHSRMGIWYDPDPHKIWHWLQSSIRKPTCVLGPSPSQPQISHRAPSYDAAASSSVRCPV